MNEWAVVKFWERVRGPCRLCIPCTTIHCQSCSCIKGLVWWILSLAGCLQSAEVGRDHDPVAPVNDGRCHCRARPGDCLEAGSSLWLSAPLFLPPHSPPQGPGSAEGPVCIFREGTSIHRCRGFPRSCPAFGLPVLGLNPFPHELLVHSSVNFSHSFLLLSPLLFLPALLPNTYSSLETQLKYHLLCATSYSPADRGLHFYHFCLFFQQ